MHQARQRSHTRLSPATSHTRRSPLQGALCGQVSRTLSRPDNTSSRGSITLDLRLSRRPGTGTFIAAVTSSHQHNQRAYPPAYGLCTGTRTHHKPRPLRCLLHWHESLAVTHIVNAFTVRLSSQHVLTRPSVRSLSFNSSHSGLHWKRRNPQGAPAPPRR